MAIRRGLEPLTSAVTGRRSNQLNYRTKTGADGGIRTRDLILTKDVRYHLCHISILFFWGVNFGGATQTRTGDKGVADLCLTAWLWRHFPNF